MPRLRIKYSCDESCCATPWIRWISLTAASLCFSWGGMAWLERHSFQTEAKEMFDTAATDRTAESIALSPAATPKRHHIPRLMAKLEIPRLSVSGFVEDGFDARTLQHAIGHSPYSARLGEPGNVVLAGHRDTFFAGLRDVKVGDIVDLKSVDGRIFHYEVARIFIVSPTESWVFKSSPETNLLTLITCYPFQFVGNAPNRLVVQAEPIHSAEAARDQASAGKSL